MENHENAVGFPHPHRHRRVTNKEIDNQRRNRSCNNKYSYASPLEMTERVEDPLKSAEQLAVEVSHDFEKSQQRTHAYHHPCGFSSHKNFLRITTITMILLPYMFHIRSVSGGYSGDEYMTCDSAEAMQIRQARVLRNAPCDLKREGFCRERGSFYPEIQMKQFNEENKALMRRLYGDMTSDVIEREMKSINTPIIFQRHEHNNNDGGDERDTTNKHDIDSDDPLLAIGMLPQHKYRLRFGSGMSKSSEDDVSSKLSDRKKILKKKRKRKVENTTTTTTSTEMYDNTEEKRTNEQEHTKKFGSIIFIDEKEDLYDETFANNVTSTEKSWTQTKNKRATTSPSSPIMTTQNMDTEVGEETSTLNQNTSAKEASPNPSTTTTPALLGETTTVEKMNTTEILLTTRRMDNTTESIEVTEVIKTEDKNDDKSMQITEKVQLLEAQPLTDDRKSSNDKKNGEALVKENVTLKDENDEIVSQFKAVIDEEKIEEAGIVYEGEAVHACSVKVEVAAPYWATNVRGQSLALLNIEPLVQHIHMEICEFPDKQEMCSEGCKCEQQYRLHRLLAFDPGNECRGIFSDWFRFPSYCNCKCYNHAQRRYDERKKKEEDTKNEVDIEILHENNPASLNKVEIRDGVKKTERKRNESNGRSLRRSKVAYAFTNDGYITSGMRWSRMPDLQDMDLMARMPRMSEPQARSMRSRNARSRQPKSLNLN